MDTAKCPNCGKLISLRFPIHNCRKIIRYFVSPASTIRGWFLKRVTLVDGVEKDDGWKEKFRTKREANDEAVKRNQQLYRRGDFVSSKLPSSGIAEVE